MPSRVTLAGAALAGALSLAACGDPPPVPARPTAVTHTPAPPAPAPPAASTCPPLPKQTPTGARVLVDVSASLKGFAGKKQLENLHRALEAALAAVGAREGLERCVVGVGVDCAKAPGLVAGYDDPKLYTAADGRLDLALGRPPLLDGCPDPKTPDPIEVRALTILLSDGVQSTSTSSRTQGGAAAPDPACAEGPSPACVRALLAARVDDGLALSVVALWLPFHGTFYPEVAITEAMWSEIEAHRLELRVDPRFQGKVDFTFSKPKLPLAATGGFAVDGARPLVALVVGHDAALVARFIGAWQDELVKLAVVGGGQLASVAIAPLPPVAARLTRVERLPGPHADGVLPGRTAREGDALVQMLACEESGTAELRAVLDAPFQEVAGAVRRTLALKASGAALPASIATAFVAEGAPPVAFRMTLACRQLRGVVKPRFTLAATAAPLDGVAWWRRFDRATNPGGMAGSSSWVSPERVHGLDELVQALVERQAKAPQVADALVLEVERR